MGDGEQFAGGRHESTKGGIGWLADRCGQPAVRRASRVVAAGDVERGVIGASGDPDPVGVAQVTDNVVCGPVSAPGRGNPVGATKSLEDRDEPLPLLAEHVQQVLRVEVAHARGLQ